MSLHSRDRVGTLRDYLAERAGLQIGDRVLDICTGTGSVLRNLASRVGKNGTVFGVDFSGGMLRRAKEKYNAEPNIFLIQANVAALPFRTDVFEAVTCSHAFYELKRDTSQRCGSRAPPWKTTLPEFRLGRAIHIFFRPPAANHPGGGGGR